MQSVSVLERVIGLSRSAVVGGFVLVLSNLIPLAGVLWWGWDAFVVLFLYWLENGVIGVINALKIRKVEEQRGSSAASVLPLFIGNYGIFWLVHGVFVLVLPAFANAPFTLSRISPLGLALALAALAISHAGNYVFVFLRDGEYLRTDPQRQLFQPYPRLFTLHFAIIFGAIAVGLLGQPIALVVLLVLFKTTFEAVFFYFDRRGRIDYGSSGGTDGPPGGAAGLVSGRRTDTHPRRARRPRKAESDANSPR